MKSKEPPIREKKEDVRMSRVDEHKLSKTNLYKIEGDTTVVYCFGRGELHEVTIDTEDLERVLQVGRKWYLTFDWNDKPYAIISNYNGNSSLRMHTFLISNIPEGNMIDHIDGNSLNNCKNNLRVVTSTENNRNIRLNRRNKSGHHGVFWDEKEQKWKVTITADKKQIYLGRYSELEKAIQVRKQAEQQYWGEER